MGLLIKLKQKKKKKKTMVIPYKFSIVEIFDTVQQQQQQQEQQKEFFCRKYRIMPSFMATTTIDK